MIDFGYNVTLHPLSRNRLDMYRSWRNNPSIYKWCRQDDLIDEISQEKWFNSQSQDPKIRMYEIQNDDGPIGVCGLTDIDRLHRRAEFSLYIAPDYHRRGYAQEGLKTLFWWGFREMGLNVIYGEVIGSNPSSGIFERLGMKKEGSRTDFYWQGGRFIDAHLYSVRASEWSKLWPLPSQG